MWKCPHCQEDLESLDFNASTRGYECGSAQLSDVKEEDYDRVVDHDYSDGGTDETYDYEYTCPECEANVSLRELIWKEDEEDEEEEQKKKDAEPEETKHKIITPKNNIISDKQAKDTTENAMICSNKKCKYVFVYQKENYDAKNEFCECPRCGTSNSISNYLKTFNNT